MGVMVDGNVCVQCMMGDVVPGWCAVVVSGNQIHDSYVAVKTFIMFQKIYISNKWCFFFTFYSSKNPEIDKKDIKQHH